MISKNDILNKMKDISNDCISLMKSVTDLSTGTYSQKLLAREISESVSRILASHKTIIDELKEMDDKEFFWEDKSGRGYSSKSSKDVITNTFLYMDEEERSWDGFTLKEWLDDVPDIGDVWENAAMRITKIK